MPPLVIQMEAVSAGSMRDSGVVVAEGVNWSVAPGDYWAIAGLHGSGKGDLLQMTAGLTPPHQGTYHLFGQEMPIPEGGRFSARLRVALVFENGQLFNYLTVAENVALPLRYHHDLSAADAQAAVQAMLEATGLLPWAARTPGMLGRNWQKRAGLARALMLKPELLLLDNPLGGLDLPHTGWWLEFLDRLAAGHPLLDGRPVTLVASTADLRPWKHHARQFAVLRDKRLVVLGSWDQVAGAEAGLLREVFTGAAPEERAPAGRGKES